MNYRIYSLSEQAITLSFGEVIDDAINDKVLASVSWIKENPFDGLKEVVPAFSSFTVFYDILEINKKVKGQSAYSYVKDFLEEIPFDSLKINPSERNWVTIPVKYNGPDLNYVAEHCGLKTKDLIKRHKAGEYRVYMMGFLPGFAYLGGLDAQLSTPRKISPELSIPAGSVGIAGQQTGVYPIESPGGWQIIGKTEIVLFDPAKRPMTLLKVGDYIKFEEV
ncbi:MAG: 5-oxoprolinase subunit PxpB [Cytophagales bacterium]|nr:5-oxoprolinase subunit PxpB [Cytophagales bacterium]